MFKSDCGKTCDKACRGFEEVIYPLSLAVAYIPRQIVCELYSPCQALEQGTVFPELDKPYKMPFGAARQKKTDCETQKLERRRCGCEYR